MEGVDSVVGEEHEGAFAGDDVDRVIAAEGNGGVGDGAAAGAGAVHPDAADAGLGAVGDGRVGRGGRRQEKHSFDRWLNVLHAREARPSVQRGGTGVDGDDVASAAEEFVEEVDTEMFGIAGDTNQGQASRCEEGLNGFKRGRHGSSPCGELRVW